MYTYTPDVAFQGTVKGLRQTLQKEWLVVNQENISRCHRMLLHSTLSLELSRLPLCPSPGESAEPMTLQVQSHAAAYSPSRILRKVLVGMDQILVHHHGCGESHK